MEFNFILSKYDDTTFIPEISEVSEQLSVLTFKKKLPKIARWADKMHSRPKISYTNFKKGNIGVKITGIILLLLGIIMFVPGIMEPSLFLTCVGLFDCMVGIFYLRSSRRFYNTYTSNKPKINIISKASKKAAIAMFNEYKQFPEDEIKIQFTNDETNTAIYDEIEHLFITKHLFVFINSKKIYALQKKDLETNNIDEFLTFITEKSQNAFEIIDID